MRAELLAFEGRLKGGYRMAPHYENGKKSGHGKSEAGIDRVSVTFVELAPDEKIVERIQFENAGPEFSEPMTMTTTLRAVKGGTKVTVACAQVSPSIPERVHLDALATALRQLAALTE
jgi:uncharacterized protein YndB with AHSA1/START domain